MLNRVFFGLVLRLDGSGLGRATTKHRVQGLRLCSRLRPPPEAPPLAGLRGEIAAEVAGEDSELSGSAGPRVQQVIAWGTDPSEAVAVWGGVLQNGGSKQLVPLLGEDGYMHD